LTASWPSSPLETATPFSLSSSLFQTGSRITLHSPE
jgi:hypothetical protein